MGNTHDDVAEHLDEAAVAVPGEPLVAGLLDERLEGIGVETEVEHGVHHARHGLRRTGAHGNKKRILLVAKLCTHELLEPGEVLEDLLPETFGIGALVGVEIGAGLRGDREAGRNGKPDARHVGKVGTLSTKQMLHVGTALGLTCTEEIDILSFFFLHLRITTHGTPAMLSSFDSFFLCRKA